MKWTRLLCVALTIVGSGALLGIAALGYAVPFALRAGGLRFVAVAGLRGAVVGLFLSPIVVLCLRRRRLSVGLLAIVGSTFASSALVLSTAEPLLIVITSPATLLAGSLAALALLPTYSSFMAHQCQHCVYVLTGNQSGRCPECGELVVHNGVAPAIVAGRKRRSLERDS